MLERLISRLNLDALGIGASLLCAVHCALLPLLMTAIPLFGTSFTGHGLGEYILLGTSFVIGCVALGRGYFYRHQRILPLLLFSLGFVILVAGHFIPAIHDWELLMIAIGAVAIIVAHWLNIRHCRNCAVHKPADTAN